MNDFLQFVSVVASTPRLALALLTEALQQAWTPLLCAGIMFAGFVAIWRRWQKRRRKDGRERQDTVMMPTQVGQEDSRNEAAFQEWYAARMDASHIIFAESQARWLYAAYLSNIEIIKAQVASKVKQ